MYKEKKYIYSCYPTLITSANLYVHTAHFHTGLSTCYSVAYAVIRSLFTESTDEWKPFSWLTFTVQNESIQVQVTYLVTHLIKSTGTRNAAAKTCMNKTRLFTDNSKNVPLKPRLSRRDTYFPEVTRQFTHMNQFTNQIPLSEGVDPNDIRSQSHTIFFISA